MLEFNIITVSWLLNQMEGLTNAVRMIHKIRIEHSLVSDTRHDMQSGAGLRDEEISGWIPLEINPLVDFCFADERRSEMTLCTMKLLEYYLGRLDLLISPSTDFDGYQLMYTSPENELKLLCSRAADM